MSAPGGAPDPGPPRLHLPDEPLGRRERWLAAVLDGEDLASVVGGGDGVAGWLWARWSVLGSFGIGARTFEAAVVDYRREIGFWLVGERLWEQCCAGLIGRLLRRLPTRSL